MEVNALGGSFTHRSQRYMEPKQSNTNILHTQMKIHQDSITTQWFRKLFWNISTGVHQKTQNRRTWAMRIVLSCMFSRLISTPPCQVADGIKGDAWNHFVCTSCFPFGYWTVCAFLHLWIWHYHLICDWYCNYRCHFSACLVPWRRSCFWDGWHVWTSLHHGLPGDIFVSTQNRRIKYSKNQLQGGRCDSKLPPRSLGGAQPWFWQGFGKSRIEGPGLSWSVPNSPFLRDQCAITKITVHHTAILVWCEHKTISLSGARSTVGPGQHCISWRKSRGGRHLGRERWSLVAILIITNHPSVKGWWPTWSSYQE